MPRRLQIGRGICCLTLCLAAGCQPLAGSQPVPGSPPWAMAPAAAGPAGQPAFAALPAASSTVYPTTTAPAPYYVAPPASYAAFPAPLPSTAAAMPAHPWPHSYAPPAGAAAPLSMLPPATVGGPLRHEHFAAHPGSVYHLPTHAAAVPVPSVVRGQAGQAAMPGQVPGPVPQPLAAPVPLPGPPPLPAEAPPNRFQSISENRSLLSAAGPGLLAPASYGTSVQGRPLEQITLGEGEAAVLVVGPLCGSDLAAAELADRLAASFVQQRQRIAGALVVLVREPNPDGRALRVRENSRHVLLDRNFAASDWRKVPGIGRSWVSGDRPATEPEAQALARLVEAVRPRRAVLIRQGGQAAVQAAGPSDEAARRAAEIAQLPLAPLAAAEMSGSLQSFLARDRGVETVTLLAPIHLSDAALAARLEMAAWSLLEQLPAEPARGFLAPPAAAGFRHRLAAPPMTPLSPLERLPAAPAPLVPVPPAAPPASTASGLVGVPTLADE